MDFLPIGGSQIFQIIFEHVLLGGIVPVKGHAGDAGPLGQLRDGDCGERLLAGKLDQGRCDTFPGQKIGRISFFHEQTSSVCNSWLSGSCIQAM